MNKRNCILVEYFNDKENEESTTFELFRSIDEAYKFAESVTVYRIDLVIANNIFYEFGKINYEDRSNTIEKGIISDNY